MLESLPLDLRFGSTVACVDSISAALQRDVSSFGEMRYLCIVVTYIQRTSV
jgi:hypothetical protein